MQLRLKSFNAKTESTLGNSHVVQKFGFGHGRYKEKTNDEMKKDSEEQQLMSDERKDLLSFLNSAPHEIQTKNRDGGRCKEIKAR